jgi:hypothetical protein
MDEIWKFFPQKENYLYFKMCPKEHNYFVDKMLE